MHRLKTNYNSLKKQQIKPSATIAYSTCYQMVFKLIYMKKTRVLKQEKCSECEKIGIHAKNLCQACYSKSRRQTPEGKKALRLYNQTKGKIAQQKYLSKKPPKPPKEKKMCECGKLAIAKKMCRNCYQNKYTNKSYVYKPKENKVVDFSPIYKKVLDYVKKGNTIEFSCKSLNVNMTTFYKNITPIQKKEIKSYKIIGNISEVDDYDDFL